MEQKIIDLFTINKYVMIKSTITKMPYIDKNGACFMMNSMSEAKQFTDIRKNTECDELKNYNNIQSLVDTFYQQGIKKINVKLNEKDDFFVYEIKKEDLKTNRYCNHEANFLLIRYHETGEKKYLKALKKCLFITPVALPHREEAQYQEIKYCVLKYSGKRYYLMFTTLQEFNKWNTSQILDYSPLEINFLKADRIRKDNGIIVNPLSVRMLLEDETIQVLNKEKAK